MVRVGVLLMGMDKVVMVDEGMSVVPYASTQNASSLLRDTGTVRGRGEWNG